MFHKVRDSKVTLTSVCLLREDFPAISLRVLKFQMSQHQAESEFCFPKAVGNLAGSKGLVSL